MVGVVELGAALRLRAGRAAARYVLVLLLGASVVQAVPAVGVVDVVARSAMLLSVACGVVAAVLMYVPPANRWFAAQRP